MTALKKTVRTRRGVEPAGRPARREVELGKKSTNELVQERTLCAATSGSASAGRVGMRSKSSRDVTVSCIACDVMS